MKDPSPLLDNELPEEVASMLRAANEDIHPDPAAQGARLLARFGKPPVSAAAPSVMSTLSQRFGSLRGAVAFTGLAAAVGLAAFAWRTTSDEPSAPIARAVPVAPVAVPPASSVAEPASSLPSIDVSALPTSPLEAKRAPARAATKVERTSLDDELARVDQARGLFASGKPADALAVVNAYRREYPAQTFADEADSLEIRALAAQGRTSEARVLAERFLTKRPGSPYAEPVRAAVGLAQ